MSGKAVPEPERLASLHGFSRPQALQSLRGTLIRFGVESASGFRKLGHGLGRISVRGAPALQ